MLFVQDKLLPDLVDINLDASDHSLVVSVDNVVGGGGGGSGGASDRKINARV